ncbi:MAG: hypothetical protein BroJett005_11490 [Ignavibacteriota bacterium]|nr:MAG: hypothetical protein BroJett005_11490 [Ignavibacteriota bacterium]
MENEIVKIKGQDYLKLRLIEVKQKGNVFYISNIPAKYLLQIYTVRPAKYDLVKHSEFANSFPDENDYYQHLINEDKKKLDNKDFQRDPSDSRIKQISEFLTEEEYAFFPNSIIANCELINDYDEFNIDVNNNLEDLNNIGEFPKNLSFLFMESSNIYIVIPLIENSILVIDGQHRLKGLEKVNKAIIDNYDLILTIIVGYDRSVIAKQFYTINFEQKPVNKSILYQLTGEFTREINEISFLHNVVKMLNEIDNSPFYKRIKMLGKIPSTTAEADRKKMSISQAFLVDYLLKHISQKNLNGLYLPVFLFYYIEQERHILFIKFLARYFKAIKNIKSDWNNPDLSVLSKGMGVGALIKILHFIFPILLFDKYKGDPISTINIEEKELEKILLGIEKIDFTINGPFKGIGSAGSINKIKVSLVENLSFFNYSDYESFELNFKETYLLKTKTWLSKLLLKK